MPPTERVSTARRNQRERLIDAMIDLAAARGYRFASVARVSRAAGVSTQTFYELFADREACLLAAYRTVASRVRDSAQPPNDLPARDMRQWTQLSRETLEGALGAVAVDPDGARVLLLEALGAEDAVAAQRTATQRRFEQCAHELLASTPSGGPVLDLPAQALVGALRGVAARRLLEHREWELTGLAPKLHTWLRCYTRADGVRFSTGPTARLPAGTIAGRRSAPDTPMRLPKGPHRLSAAAVERNHRSRIVKATATVVERDGYGKASVSGIVAEARISRSVFYTHFASKKHAVLGALELTQRRLLDACECEFAVATPWSTRIWCVLGVLLDAAAANPPLARLCVAGCYAAGPEATRQAEQMTRPYARLLHEGYSQRPAAAKLPALCSEAVTGAILAIIRSDLEAGAAAALPYRLPQLAHIAITPFTGPVQAAKAIERLIDATDAGSADKQQR